MVTGGNKLGDLTVGIRAPLGSFRQDLTQAEGAATSTGGKIGSAFGKAQNKIQGAARQVPIFGNQLAALATPTGAATLAFGALTTAIVGSVSKVINLERELRPMIARSGLAAESLQVFSIAATKLGSEDGLEGVTDSVQELQLRLAEAVQDGTGPAVAAFEKLGLASEDLIDKSPEEMFLAVITALQNVTNEADKKFLADELLGGSSEKLAGIINTEAASFKALTREIEQTHAIASTTALEGAAELSKEMDKLGQNVDKVQLQIGMALIPAVNNITDEFTEWKDETVEGFKWWGQVPGMLEGWVTGIDQTTPSIAELGDGFEDVATDVLSAAGTFDKANTSSFPYMIDDGMNTAVQAMGHFKTAYDELEEKWKENSAKVIGYAKDTTSEIGYQEEGYKNLKQEAEAAESVVTSKSLSMKDGVIDHGKPMREDIDKTTGSVKALEAATGDAQIEIDKDWKQMEDDADEHLGNIQSDIGTWVTDSLQAYKDSYGDKLQEQLDFYDAEDGLIKTQAQKFTEIEADTGIHLTNIQSMYAATGIAVATSWAAMMNGMATQVDRFIGGVSGHQGSDYMPKMFQSTGALNPFGPGKSPTVTSRDDATFQVSIDGGNWVSMSMEDYRAIADDPDRDFTIRTRYVSDSSVLNYGGGRFGGFINQDTWSQWLYYLDRLMADPITAGDPRALTRSDLGLGPVGSTPPTLPGLPGFATGGIAMRPMAANIAEHGPEAIIPLDRMQPTINVIFQDGAVLANDAVEFVLDALHEASRRGAM